LPAVSDALPRRQSRRGESRPGGGPVSLHFPPPHLLHFPPQISPHPSTRKAMTPMNPPPQHQPVLLQRCLDLLAPALSSPGAVLIDATLGLGGHDEAALSRVPRVQLGGLDRNPKAPLEASER